MTLRNNQMILVFFIALAIYTTYLLAPILTPFLLGSLLAYLMDPLVKNLEKRRIPHILSVTFTFLLLFCFFIIIVLLLTPIVQMQTAALIELTPQMMDWLQNTAFPLVKEFATFNTIKTTLTASLAKTGWMVDTVLRSSYTLIEWTINLVLTAVVTFYLLRDWDKVLIKIKSILPKSKKTTIIHFARECDEVLGAFFRGQLLVMLALSLIYSIGLTLAGLKVGFMIGIIGGLLSLVPYLGSLFVLIMSTLTALAQFGGIWEPILWVWVVFLIGQGIEGYILTPYLVGERLGLHPVAVIFSIMAGGALFGFFGVLLALPAAAVTMVLLRYLNKWYQQQPR